MVAVASTAVVAFAAVEVFTGAADIIVAIAGVDTVGIVDIGGSIGMAGATADITVVVRCRCEVTGSPASANPIL